MTPPASGWSLEVINLPVQAAVVGFFDHKRKHRAA